MELDGTLTSTTYLVDGVRNFFVLDVSLIGGIVEDEGVVLQGIVHPLAQLLFSNNRTCRVVRIAQVDDVDATIGNLRHKAVFGITRHIHDVRPAAVVALPASTTNHHVRIDVNRIDRIGNTNGVIPAHQLLDIACITLGTIVDKDLVAVEMDAAGQKIVLEDGITQEIIALLRTIAAKALTGSLLGCHLVCSLMDGFNNSGSQGLCHIAYTQRYDVTLRMRSLKGIDLFGDISEQVVVRQLQEMIVY